ncbi:putative trehalose-phosphate phosphatase D [Sesamum angolense]|uniref:Trehalose 6-phosphate phosphatase n=1 Tax=Sesamum angolense TaxID=2727404 RepID=A0AAE2BJJ8_9LAMI|nr:putative trehalose-phosphate phosphatase D [Sesamum angolense]
MTNQANMLLSQYFTRKKLLKKLESYGNGAGINALLDSMRASSPTRRPSDAEHQDSWTTCVPVCYTEQLRHPSALSMFEEIMNASKGKQIVVFLDYDGTLSPIVEDPDRAFMTSEMREAVRDVAKFFPTAIVSGRCRAKGNQTVLCQPARKFLPMIDEVYRCLIEKIEHIRGAKVENNKFCLSVHYRCVEEKRWGELADQVKSVIKNYQQLRLSQGRKVLEIRPTIKWDKGNALEFLLESLGYAETNDVFPVYIGDDRTDEDAFKVLRNRGQGIGILVSKTPKETNASYTLKEPSEASYAVSTRVGGVEEMRLSLSLSLSLSLPRQYQS